jgi:hypothetical protein
MTTTVTSKFRSSLWTAPIFFGILVFILIAVIVNLADADYSPSNAHEIMALLLILIALICSFTYRAAIRFIKVTVSPDELLLHYLLTNKRVTVNYADIVHVSMFQQTTPFTRDISLINTVKLKIELNTGQNLYLVEEYYKNFDELKEAIRRARFGLD